MSMTRIRGTRHLQLVWIVDNDIHRDGRYIETRRLYMPQAWEAVGCILSSAL